MAHPDWNEWIDRYLRNELSPEEKREFDRQLQENPDLERELQVHRWVEEQMKEKEVTAFRENLHRVRREVASEGSIGPSRGRLVLLALILALLGSVLYYFFFRPTEPSTLDAIFAEYAMIPPTMIDQLEAGRRSVEPIDPSAEEKAFSEKWKSGIEWMRAGAYPEALELFRGMEAEIGSELNPSYRLLLGLLYIQTDQPDAALRELRSSNYPDQDLLAWYESLALLKRDGPTAVVFNQLKTTAADPNNPWRKKAAKLLEDLKGL